MQRGYAMNWSCCEDRRKIQLKLTTDGIDFVEKLLPVTRVHLQQQWKDFSQPEKDALELLMRKVLATLGG